MAIYTSFPKSEYLILKREIDQAISEVLSSGIYVLGNQEKKFEEEFAKYIGTKYCVGVANGTDALFLALKLLNLKKDDEIILPDHTSNFTAMAVSNAGAKPVFIDIHENDYSINENLIEKAITKQTKAVIPVHLYGHPANMVKIMAIAKKYHLAVIEDCCQAHGAMIEKRKVGTFGNFGCFSFYPTKNLGAIGDGGAIVCNSKNNYEKLSILRNGGQKSKYYHTSISINSRLDELQAAILRVKLKKLDYFIQERNKVAQLYDKLINSQHIIKPAMNKNIWHSFHLYVIRSKKRDRLLRALEKNNIFAQIHYPWLCHQQPCYKSLTRKHSFSISKKIVKEIISLPIYPGLEKKKIENICSVINKT